MTTQAKGELDAAARDAVRDLILVLADSKRLLGYRYAEWMLGAPELETGIACSSMAQDEWGHARLLYALLKEFGEDVEQLEHGREPDAYRNMEVLDSPAETWPDAVALMTIVDPALSAQFEALRGSGHEPLRQRVEKLLEEEKFHMAHGVAWFRRLARGSDPAREALAEAVGAVLDPVLRWFGPDTERNRTLVQAGAVTTAGPALRRDFLAGVTPLLAMVGLDDRQVDGEPDHSGFDEARRRTDPGGPDTETIRRIRGDRNRAFLMD